MPICIANIIGFHVLRVSVMCKPTTTQNYRILSPGYVLLRTGFCNDHNTLAQAIEKKPTQYQSNIPQALINQSLFLAKYTDMPSQVTA